VVAFSAAATPAGGLTAALVALVVIGVGGLLVG
jgi:hypothetical protein